MCYDIALMDPVKIKFTDFVTSHSISQNFLSQLLSERFELELSDQPDFLIYSCHGRDFINYPCIRIFYASENIKPNFNECDYAFSFDYLDSERHYRLPFYRLSHSYELLKKKKNVQGSMVGKSRFCNFIYSNNVRFRNNFFLKLSKYKSVDAPGRCMNNMLPIGCHNNTSQSRMHKNWDREKIVFQQQYKFTIAFENHSSPGYTTEKLTHAMAAGTIPIYWGNPDVAREFNSKSYINCHDYPDIDSVINTIIAIDNDDDLFRQYLEEPFFPDNQEPVSLTAESILDRFEIIFRNKKEHASKRMDALRKYLLFLEKGWEKEAVRLKRRIGMSTTRIFNKKKLK